MISKVEFQQHHHRQQQSHGHTNNVPNFVCNDFPPNFIKPQKGSFGFNQSQAHQHHQNGWSSASSNHHQNGWSSSASSKHDHNQHHVPGGKKIVPFFTSTTAGFDGSKYSHAKNSNSHEFEVYEEVRTTSIAPARVRMEETVYGHSTWSDHNNGFNDFNGHCDEGAYWKLNHGNGFRRPQPAASWIAKGI